MYREDVGWTSTTLVIQNPVELRNAFRKDLLESHCQIAACYLQSTHYASNTINKFATFIFHPSNRSMNLSSSFKGLHKIFANLQTPEEIQVASQQQVLEDGTWCREQQLLFRPGRTEAGTKITHELQHPFRA